MKKSDVFEIAIRLIGLYLLITSVVESVQGLLSIYAFAGDAKQNSDVEGNNALNPLLFAGIANLIFLIIVSFFCFFKADFIVRKICFSNDFIDDIKLFIDSKTILHLGFTLTGLPLIVFSLPDFGWSLINYIKATQNNLLHDFSDTKFLIILTSKVVVGFFIVLLSKQLAKLLTNKNQEGIFRDNNEKN